MMTEIELLELTLMLRIKQLKKTLKDKKCSKEKKLKVLMAVTSLLDDLNEKLRAM